MPITDISFLEYSIYMAAMREVGEVRYGSAGKPAGKPLFKYGGFMADKLKVYANGIQGLYGRLGKKKMSTGAFSRETFVSVELKNAFVPFPKIDGIYGVQYVFRNPSGLTFEHTGVQVDTKDHRTMVFVFDKDTVTNMQTFKWALGDFHRLYDDNTVIRGSAGLVGTSDNPTVHYHGDVHRPRVLREARDPRSGSVHIMNSQLRPEVVLSLDVGELGQLSFPEWVGYWVYWLEGTRKAVGGETTERWLATRKATYGKIMARLGAAAGSRRDMACASKLHYAIADELVDLHCTRMEGDVQVVDHDAVSMADEHVRAAMVYDPKMVDEFDLLSRIETLNRQR